MTSQCRCTRALSQSHVAKLDNHVPVVPLIGPGLGVMSMQWLPCGKIISAKTLKLHKNRGHPFTIVSPTCSRRHKNTRYSSSNSAPFSLLSSGPLNCTFTLITHNISFKEIHFETLCTTPHPLCSVSKVYTKYQRNHRRIVDGWVSAWRMPEWFRKSSSKNNRVIRISGWQCGVDISVWAPSYRRYVYE